MHQLPGRWTRKRTIASLALIFLVALVVRIAYAAISPQELTFDEPYYDYIANQIVSGNGFTFPSSVYHTSVPNKPTSFQEPLYPLLLACLKILFGSSNYLAIRVVQAALGACIPVVVAGTGYQIFRPEVGILAGLVLALYPPLIYFGRLLMTEIVYTLLLTGALLLAHITLRSRNWVGLMGGVIYGAASVTRSIAFAFTPILLLWTLLACRPKRGRLLTAAFVGAGVVVVISPWAVRDYLVHDTFVPLTTKGGYNLYFYNYPVPNYDFNTRHADVPFPDMNGLAEVDRERELTRRGIDFIKNNPRLIASFALAKLIDFWNPMLKEERAGFSIVNLLSYGVMTLFAFIGLLRQILRRNWCPTVLLMWLLIGYYMVQAMVFTGGGKARLPVEPFLVLLGSETLWDVTQWLRRHLLRTGSVLTS